MRHIFYVQSNLSSLVCQAVLKHRGIDPSHAVFILDRQTQAPGGIASVAAPKWLRFSIRKSFRFIPKNRRTRARIQSLFHEISQNQPFEIYVNRSNYHFLSVIEDDARWRATHLYEEGFAAYYRKLASSTETRNEATLTRIRTGLIEAMSGYTEHRPKRAFYSEDYGRVFATSPKAFEGFPRREVIDVQPIIRASVEPSGYPDVPTNSLVCVLPLHNAFSSDPIACERLLSTLADVITSLPERHALLKPHPDLGDHADFWDGFYDDLSVRTELDIRKQLRPNIGLEELAIARKDVMFCTVISSLAVYAGAFEMNVISIAPAVFGADHPRVVDLQRVASDAIFWDTPTDTLPLVPAIGNPRRDLN